MKHDIMRRASLSHEGQAIECRCGAILVGTSPDAAYIRFEQHRGISMAREALTKKDTEG